MRKLSELYTILLENYEKGNFQSGGWTCNSIRELGYRLGLVSSEEANLLLSHFKGEKPSKERHPEFLFGEESLGEYAWWSFKEEDRMWGISKKGLGIRKDFIKLMISLTEAEGI